MATRNGIGLGKVGVNFNQTVQNLLNKAKQQGQKSTSISQSNQAKFGFFIPPSPGQGIFGTAVINPTPEIIQTSGSDLIKFRDSLLSSFTPGFSGGTVTIPSSVAPQQTAGIFLPPPSQPQPSTPSTSQPFFESLKQGFNQIPKEVLFGAVILGAFLLLRR